MLHFKNHQPNQKKTHLHLLKTSSKWQEFFHSFKRNQQLRLSFM